MLLPCRLNFINPGIGLIINPGIGFFCKRIWNVLPLYASKLKVIINYIWYIIDCSTIYLRFYIDLYRDSWNYYIDFNIF